MEYLQHTEECNLEVIFDKDSEKSNRAKSIDNNDGGKWSFIN